MKLALYALSAVAAAAVLSSVALLRGVPIAAAALAALLPSMVLGALGLAARYPCRAMPLRKTSVTRLAGTHVASAAAAAGVWILVWQLSGLTLDVPILFGLGMVLYLGTVVVHYLVLEVDAAREAEEKVLRYQVLAREAELSAFKAQLDPHFLFNSLNAVAALCGPRPADARKMAQLLADFFRQTVRLGKLERITLAEEIDLVSRYLAIEKVRFDARLTTRIDVSDSAGRCTVPPLLLQPLVENAVRHGIASMVEGGEVEVAATVDDGKLRIRVENPADPDRAGAPGEGVGLQNARDRLNVVSDGRATFRAGESNGRYRVEIELPTSC